MGLARQLIPGVPTIILPAVFAGLLFGLIAVAPAQAQVAPADNSIKSANVDIDRLGKQADRVKPGQASAASGS